MAAPSGDQSHSETGIDVVNTGELLWWGLRAAPLIIRGLVVVHNQFLHLYKSLDDWCHPEVDLWHLYSKRQDKNTVCRFASTKYPK